MSRAELQNSIIRKVLSISDERTLGYINEILNEDSKVFYKMSDEEASLVQEGIDDYRQGRVVDSQELLDKLDKWLDK